MSQTLRRGPLGWSTSQVLARRSTGIVWDVNGYYAALGVPTTASTREIRLAYLALDGPNSARLTEMFLVLISPALRARYDAMPLGTRWLDEEHRRLRKIADRAARLRGEIPDDQWTDTPIRPLDNPPPWGEDERTPARGFDQGPYPFTILLRGTSVYSPWTLEQWQGLLIAAVRRSGGPAQIGLGVIAGEQWEAGEIHGLPFLFIGNALRPDPSEADRMVLGLS